MLSLWQMSLSAGAVILLTALLRRLAGARLPRRMYIALWDIALLSSLIPLRVTWRAPIRRFAGRIAVHPPLTAATGIPVSEGAAATLPSTAVLPAIDGIQNGLTQASKTVQEAVQASPDWLRQVLAAVWIIGAALLAAAILRRWLICRRAFAEALPCADQRVSSFLRAHPLRRRIRVRVSDRIRSPLSYGLMRPVILLPACETGMDDQTLRHVLTHEFMHIRAWDMLRKSALLFTLCLHWPNPLMWLMTRLCNRDMELMCDERVVRCVGGRKAYCLTLLDMEAHRSNLTMGTCFSVTGIEERIKVMKNRKHQGILSIALAFAILLGTTAGAMTGIPTAGAEKGSPHIFFSRETWEGTYARYAPYGLAYDETNGVITYNGQVVRYFEDMWPIDEQGKAGACFLYEGGTVDVYGVREYPEYIRRNPDGSFDPSGILKGLREATPEEYAEHTARLGNISFSTDTVLQFDAQVQEAIVLIPEEAESDAALHLWTAEEYRAWMAQQHIAMEALVAEGAMGWTQSEGWFVWTPEKMAETMTLYEDILKNIETYGAFFSDGQDSGFSIVNIQEDLPVLTSEASATSMPAAAPTPDPARRIVFSTPIPAAVSGTDEVLMQSTAISPLSQEPDMDSSTEETAFLIAVGPDDERKYPPEAWARIMELVELGVVQWTEPKTPATPGPSAYQTARMNAWSETIAPYASFGLTYALDTASDLIHLYWNGREVRGLFDPVCGVWITEHAGNGSYPDGARELIAVYNQGVLTGLREADDEESAVWDKLRSENTAQARATGDD